MSDLPDCLFCDNTMDEWAYAEWGGIDEGNGGHIPVCSDHKRKIATYLA